MFMNIMKLNVEPMNYASVVQSLGTIWSTHETLLHSPHTRITYTPKATQRFKTYCFQEWVFPIFHVCDTSKLLLHMQSKSALLFSFFSFMQHSYSTDLLSIKIVKISLLNWFYKRAF